MSSDPTQHYEPTEPVDYNPYESNLYGVPRIPPPPPKQRKRLSVWVMVILAWSVVLLVCSGVLVSEFIQKTNQTSRAQPSTVTNVPTSINLVTATSILPTPTPTALPALYTAKDVYNEFVQAGLSSPNAYQNSFLPCSCEYPASGGDISFIDKTTGNTMNIAVFDDSYQANSDAVTVQAGDGPGPSPTVTTIVRCILVSWSNIPQSSLAPYENIMSQACR